MPPALGKEEQEDRVEEEDEDDSDEEEDEEDEVVNEEVNIEFEAYSISDNDYDGIKKLLQQLFLKAPVNTAELTDLLIQQNHIGSVIKVSRTLVFILIKLAPYPKFLLIYSTQARNSDWKVLLASRPSQQSRVIKCSDPGSGSGW